MKNIYSIAEWIYRLAFVNLLWILFTLLGLVVFGLFPATMSMFSVIRKWVLGEPDPQIFRTFLKHYKRDFFKSNFIGLNVTITGMIIYMYIQYIGATLDSVLIYTHIPLYFFMVITILTFLYLPPVFVHYDVGLFQVLKNSFIIMIMNPIYTIVLVVSVLIVIYVLKYIPGALFFFGGSTVSLTMMRICYRAFQYLENRKNKLTETQ